MVRPSRWRRWVRIVALVVGIPVLAGLLLFAGVMWGDHRDRLANPDRLRGNGIGQGALFISVLLAMALSLLIALVLAIRAFVRAARRRARSHVPAKRAI